MPSYLLLSLCVLSLFVATPAQAGWDEYYKNLRTCTPSTYKNITINGKQGGLCSVTTEESPTVLMECLHSPEYLAVAGTSAGSALVNKECKWGENKKKKVAPKIDAKKAAYYNNLKNCTPSKYTTAANTTVTIHGKQGDLCSVTRSKLQCLHTAKTLAKIGTSSPPGMFEVLAECNYPKK